VCAQAWCVAGSGVPVFSAPCVCEAHSVCVVAYVDGSMRAHALPDGHLVWSIQLQGHVFGGLHAVPLRWACGSTQQACANPINTARRGAEAVVVATHTGLVYCVSAEGGAMLWQTEVGHGRISAAPAAWWEPVTGAALLLVASCSGVLSVWCVRSAGCLVGTVGSEEDVTSHLELISEAQMPGELLVG
jgi:hypothetical protein